MALTTTAVAVNYFVAIDALSANTAPVAPVDASISQFFPYAPFIVFGLLFILALGIQLYRKIWDAKNMITSIVIALSVASIPAMLSYGALGNRQEVTAAPQEIPTNVKVFKTSEDSVMISWHTDAARIGVVRLGRAPLTGGGRIYVAENQSQVLEHTVVVDNLIPNQTYEFEILSGSVWYDNNGQNIRFTFQ